MGSHDAALELGIHYQHADSDLRPARLELAEHWLRQAVKADDGTGMLALGTLLTQLGREVEGRRWLRAALAHGDGGAACHLARPLEASAPSRALRLYLQGAKLGDPFAAACAGRLLEARGTRPALLEAKRLYARALEKHLPDAAADVERVSRRLEAPGPARSAMTRKRR